MSSWLSYIKFLSPGRILLLKRILDAIEALFRLLEKLLNGDELHQPKRKPKG